MRVRLHLLVDVVVEHGQAVVGEEALVDDDAQGDRGGGHARCECEDTLAWTKLISKPKSPSKRKT